MNRYGRILLAAACMLFLAGATAWQPAQAATRFLTIGTGGVTGVYYPTGKAIAKLVNLNKKIYRLKATVESTGGSVFNINAVLKGELEQGPGRGRHRDKPGLPSGKGAQAQFGLGRVVQPGGEAGGLRAGIGGFAVCRRRLHLIRPASL